MGFYVFRYCIVRHIYSSNKKKPKDNIPNTMTVIVLYFFLFMAIF